MNSGYPGDRSRYIRDYRDSYARARSRAVAGSRWRQHIGVCAFGAQLFRDGDGYLRSSSAKRDSAAIEFLKERRGGLRGVEEFLAITGTAPAPFDTAKAEGAFRAFQRYGEGIRSKARLNLCDCAAYALAKSLNAPLLFKGDDFSATDVAPATLAYTGF